METNLLDRMLSSYLQDGAAITVTLQNKVRVSGKIITFDSYVIVLEGQRREFVYRHAVASVAAGTADGTKHHAGPAKGAPQNTRPRPPAPGRQKSEPSPRASNGEASLNTGMKEGLLRWMQEQKAAK